MFVGIFSSSLVALLGSPRKEKSAERESSAKSAYSKRSFWIPAKVLFEIKDLVGNQNIWLEKPLVLDIVSQERIVG